MGSYDSEYYVANKGTFYTADVGYSFKNVKQIGNITPYFMYSHYDKDQDSMKDSIRNIIGVSIDHKQLSLVAEYIMSKMTHSLVGLKIHWQKGMITSGISCLT